MADDRQHTVKESKGLRNRLKRAFRLGSRSTPSHSNSPSAVSVPPATPAPAVTIGPDEAAKLQAKYTRFRILVIGRANAGKTTLLKRVCNTIEEPSIFDKGKNLLEPTSKRGSHNVRHEFTFKSNPGFIFHDSPGFEAGGEEELNAVMTFIQQSSKAKEVDDQIHVIWFCFELDESRPLLPLEVKFFDENRAWNVPVVAIFMKFDDLITQVFDMDKDEIENTNNALDTLDKKFKQPLSSYKFPPRAYVRFKAIHKDEGNHQEQVGELIKQTAASIDNLALKMLFVTVQQNNLEACIEYAVNEYIFESTNEMWDLINKAASWFGHCCMTNQDYGEKEDLDVFDADDHPVFRGAARYGGYYPPHAFDAAKKFTQSVVDLVSAQFNVPSLNAFIAILICLEHSFWLTQPGSSPTDGFIKALDTYIKEKCAPLDQRLDDYLKSKQSTDWFARKHHPSPDECTEFRKIIFDNLLPRPEPSV